ncbi:MAG: ribosome maturation factor RimP [Desulfohalobiaceae bacterium]|nr:ribosome maturation factor RimP [Desulfohalobiaceae bacterium]
MFQQEALRRQLEELFRPLLESMGLRLWGLQVPAARGGTVRVYIDSPDGVSIDQCAQASRHLSHILDAEDPIPGSYTLEVSSPGMERPFFSPDQVREYLGNSVQLKTRVAVQGRKKWRGIIIDIEGDRIHMETDLGPQAFDWQEIRTIHLLAE